MEQLVIDRTQEDAEYAFVNQHLPDLKGAYNANDLNRVATWVNYLAKLLFLSVNLKNTWTQYDKPNENDFNIYLNGVRTVRNSLSIYGDHPTVPQSINELGDPNGWNRANDIEKNLLLVYDRIQLFPFSGEIYAGEM